MRRDPEGLDPRAERPGRRSLEPALQGRRQLRLSFFAETTSKILVLSTDGKIFTLEASKLPGGRGAGEPIRLLADIDDGEDVVAVFVYEPGGKCWSPRPDGRGFLAAAGRNDRQYRARARCCSIVDAPGQGARSWSPVEGDHVAAIGENRKLLVFPLAEIPEMTRGKGVRLQRYKDGGISDIKTFALPKGLSWTIRPAAFSTCRRQIWRNGSATAPKPAACRRRAFRRPTSSGDGRRPCRAAPVSPRNPIRRSCCARSSRTHPARSNRRRTGNATAPRKACKTRNYGRLSTCRHTSRRALDTRTLALASVAASKDAAPAATPPVKNTLRETCVEFIECNVFIALASIPRI